MAFMKKETVEEYARLFGIDLEGKAWGEQNQLVRERLEAEGYTIDKNGEVHKPVKEEPKPEPKPEIPNKTIMLSPEIRATNIQLIKYDEELGEDLTVEEVSFKDDFGTRPIERDLTYGTYKIKGSSGRKVVAQSTVPKENAQVTYNPARDLVPRVTYDGKTGYIWTHQHYPNIKGLLMDSGKYHKYKHLFSAKEHPENIWYAAGKLLVCNISMVHYVFDEIEREYRAGN